MIGHAQAWIDAYLDGELPPAQMQQAQAHLAQCPDCRNLLAQRQALAALLQEVPPARNLKPEARFVAEVGLQLKQRPAPANLHGLPSGWQLIPVFLLLALAFVQAIFILSDFAGFIPGAEQALLSQTPGAALPLAELSLPIGDLVSLLGVFNLFNWDWLAGLAVVAVLGLGYLAWLAGWWARSRQAA